jgi:hypothetical protein
MATVCERNITSVSPCNGNKVNREFIRLKNYSISSDSNYGPYFTIVLVVSIFCVVLLLLVPAMIVPVQLFLSIIALVTWVSLGGKNWWMAFPCMATFGGYFTVGFKIYPDEAGLLLSVLALIPAIIQGKQKIIRHRSPISWAFKALISYFILHMAVSLYYADADLLSGAGSIIRTYSKGLTYLLFCWLFYKYGDTKNLKTALSITFFVILIRIIIAVSFFLSSDFNLDSGTGIFVFQSTDDLRASAILNMLLAVILFYISKNKRTKAVIILDVLFMIPLVLIGQGRVSVAVAAVILILWLVIEKKIKQLIIFSFAALLLFTLLYNNVGVLQQLSPQAQRALSFLPGFQPSESLGIESSDEWHFDLMEKGYEKWVDSWHSILFGNRIISTGIYEFEYLDTISKLEIAAGMARYENALWMTLATLGLCGLILYVFIFAFLFRSTIPILIKEGISDYTHAVYFAAFISFALLLLFGWISGGFPRYELMFGIMAKALYEDDKLRSINSNHASAQ